MLLFFQGLNLVLNMFFQVKYTSVFPFKWYLTKCLLTHLALAQDRVCVVPTSDGEAWIPDAGVAGGGTLGRYLGPETGASTSGISALIRRNSRQTALSQHRMRTRQEKTAFRDLGTRSSSETSSLQNREKDKSAACNPPPPWNLGSSWTKSLFEFFFPVGCSLSF